MNIKETDFIHIGSIPFNWNVVRLKDIAQINKGNVFDEKLSLAEGVYPYINGGINPSDWSNEFNSKANTIAVSEGGASAGYTQFMKTKYWAGSHCYKIQSKNKHSDNKYLFYVLKGFEQYLMIEKTGSAMPNLQKTKFINYLVSFVNDLETQNKIVSYLDTETSKIDRKISILEQKYEKLEEYKQSVIFETVTKGLDSNISMKNSGIDWIGEIPAHWEVKRVKDISKIKKGKAVETYLEKSDEMLPCIDTNFLRGRDNIVFCKNGTKINSEKVLILWDGANAGELFFNKEIGYLGSTFGVFNTSINNKFWFYYLKGIEQYSRDNLTGMGVPHVDGTVLKQTVGLIPPKQEQEKIAIFLDIETSKINKKKEIIKKQIELLKEYKQSIIYEAVTGKGEIL